jgi:hypothetical protein
MSVGQIVVHHRRVSGGKQLRADNAPNVARSANDEYLHLKPPRPREGVSANPFPSTRQARIKEAGYILIQEIALEATGKPAFWRYSRLLVWLLAGEPEWTEKTLVATFAAKRPQQSDHGQKSFMHQAMRLSDVAVATSWTGQDSHRVLSPGRMLDQSL